MPALEIDQLTVRFGSVTAVEGLTLDASSGEVLALLGPNGAGKTTTVETVEGFRRPTAGRVRVLGLDPVDDRRRLTPRLGVMLQSCRLQAGLRPAEALRLFASYYPERASPDDLLDRVGLRSRATTPYRRLSGGEQQRLALALAIVGRPEVAVLDEPTAGLDLDGRRLVREVVADLAAGGACVIVTSHELVEVERFAHRLAIIDGGRLVAVGTAAELAARAAGSAGEIRFAAAPGLPTGELAGAVGGAVSEVEPGEYRLDLEPTPGNVARLTAWMAERDLTLGDLRAGRPRLEDVFARLTSSGRDDRGDNRR